MHSINVVFFLAMKFNFQKQTTSSVNSLGVSYDYYSVMHYGATAFARARGLTTISSKQGHRTLGQRRGLSPKDKQQVKLLYKCGGTTVKPTKPTGEINVTCIKICYIKPSSCMFLEVRQRNGSSE